ncbi:signal peptidase 22 kDa subunit [Exidia glandulosa HHB12029]|uniref:Signal peptidase subunit 3 n=1 Tax=Exidia glandulosa HHB12029 TaxID=1314781 RepID=A0A165PBL9_EXIGL|nr:signal peptidase 22 kDa subunit [Exidia glandulosa HHB12029]
MHTAYQRLSNVSAFLTSCAMVLVALITIASLPPPPDVSSVVNLSVAAQKVLSGRRANYGRERDYAFFKFDYSGDLRPLFDWNTKQVFLYLVADYTNSQGVHNEVVIWDRIVRRKEDARLRIADQNNKYPFKDYSTTFKNSSDVGFTMHYNIMPHVGILKYGTVGTISDRVQFPAKEAKTS